MRVKWGMEQFIKRDILMSFLLGHKVIRSFYLLLNITGIKQTQCLLKKN